MTPHTILDDATAWLRAHYDAEVCRGLTVVSGADLLDVNLNNLKARHKRGQLYTLHSHGPAFTGEHMVANLIVDRFLRHGSIMVPPKVLVKWLRWVRNHVLSGEMNRDAVLRCVKRSGSAAFHLYEGWSDLEEMTGEAATIVPIGTMVTRLAVALYVRSGAYRDGVRA
jgi:hypothetical protein